MGAESLGLELYDLEFPKSSYFEDSFNKYLLSTCVLVPGISMRGKRIVLKIQ